jgi:hypothetical protein
MVSAASTTTRTAEVSRQTRCVIVLAGCRRAVALDTNCPVLADRFTARELLVEPPTRSVVVRPGERRAVALETNRPVDALLETLLPLAMAPPRESYTGVILPPSPACRVRCHADGAPGDAMTPPNSHPATNTEDHLEAHHSAGRCPRRRHRSVRMPPSRPKTGGLPGRDATYRAT